MIFNSAILVLPIFFPSINTSAMGGNDEINIVPGVPPEVAEGVVLAFGVDTGVDALGVDALGVVATGVVFFGVGVLVGVVGFVFTSALVVDGRVVVTGGFVSTGFFPNVK